MILFPKKRGRRPHEGAGTSRFQTEVGAQLESYGFFGCDKPHKIEYAEKHTYTPDFILPNETIIEVKGYFPPEDRSKMLHVKESNPNLDIRFIFSSPRKTLTKTSKTTYGEWATKNGFKWAEKKIPVEWLYEEKGDVHTA